MEHLKADQAVYEAIQKELGRQRDKLEMIALKILSAML